MRLAMLLAWCGAACAASCDDLRVLALEHVSIGTAAVVPPGRFHGVEVGAPMCRVAGNLRPSPDSDIVFEVWMPAENWNGKFQGVGNGGFAGSIDYRGLNELVGHGYAAAATDTGHTAGMTDARWALGHPQKVQDFAYRAIHETAVAAKALVQAFYGSAPRRSYFSSCSNGGRQALMEAQRYPADYDGIVAGAPANYWTHLLTAGAWEAKLMADPATRIPPAKLPAIEAATLEVCDAGDGVKDGLIGDPTRCRFDPAALLCKGADSDACLTAPQVDTLRKILSGPKNSRGDSLFPGKEPGGILGGEGWSTWIIGSAPGRSLGGAFAVNFFANMVFENPQWQPAAFDVDRDPAAADRKVAAVLNATDPDLKRFRDRGGKLIVWHGWSDAGIAPRNSIDYYNSVVKKMGAHTAADFVRLYMAPGVAHCAGGPGPDDFGQGSADSGVNGAIEAWVEHGTAPAAVIASGKGRTRPLCPFPQVAKWKGSGSTDDAANFVCAMP